MTGKTHLSAGLLCGLASYPFFGEVWLLGIAFSALGSLFPDFDHPDSTVSHMGFRLFKGGFKIKPFRVFSAFGALFFRHRGATHTFLGAIICSVILFFLLFGLGVPLFFEFSVLFGLGYLSHLLLDAFTPSGIPFWKPFWKKRVRLAKIKTGAHGDLFFGLGLLLVFAVLLLHLFFLGKVSA